MKDRDWEVSKEITVSKYCKHQDRWITVSNNPLKNECERCFEYYIESQTKDKIA
jgi:hypothetical protein